MAGARYRNPSQIRTILAGGILVAGITSGNPVRVADTVPVPCQVSALETAMWNAGRSDRLSLAANCTYVLDQGLPAVTQDLAIVGNGATLERSFAPGTPTFTILESTCCALDVSGLNFRNGNNAITVNGGSLTVTGGTFTGNAGTDGGAIADPASGLDGPAVSNATFIANRATDVGGAIYNNSAGNGVDVTNCKFSGNEAAGDGGAIYDFAALGDTVSGSVFRANSAEDGGALLLDPLFGDLSRDVIVGNTAHADAGGVFSVFDVTIKDSRLIGNHAAGGGGGLYVDYQGFLSSVTDTTFNANTASDGGAIYNALQFIGIDLTRVIVTGNRASARGGGIYNQGAMDVATSQIIGNSAISGGGGIYDDGSQFGGTTTLTTTAVRANVPDNCEPVGSITGCVG
ncbi:MAG TPA: hypothetical protein VN767_26910 [Streptosporangiaceae bacterium]|nr:hypothetical protein [Streptosporangiaceae bacterium]